MPQQPLEHEFYYGDEAEQYIFYRFPKALFTNEIYANVSDGAKILYGLMLDRMGLSIKNQWLDNKGRVYIYYTLEDIQDFMHWGHNKGVRIMTELESYGLIERVKQGQGKPAIIYVKRFQLGSGRNGHDPPKDSHEIEGSQGFPKEEVQTSLKRKPRLPEQGSAGFPKGEGNKNKYNNNNLNENNPIQSYLPQGIPTVTLMDGWDTDGIDADKCRREIRSRLDYYTYLDDAYDAIEQLDELVELMVEIQCTNKPTIQIAGNEYPIDLVKQRFSKITGKHIEYVIGCFKENTTRIHNIKQYLLSALFNAPATVEHYYTAEFNHLYYGGGAARKN